MRATFTAALAAALLLTGCGGGDDEDRLAGDGQPVGSASDTSQAALKKAAQGYADAFISANIVKASVYLPPECTDEDRGAMALGLSMFKGMVGDADVRMIVEEVTATGEQGEVLRYSFSGDVPDELERLMTKGDGAPSDRELWKVVDGKWYRADCEG